MSLLNELAQQASSGFLANVFGTNNRSLQGDCLDISDVGSYAAKLAKYPQCAPYISAAGPITTAPVVSIPGSGQIVPQYTGMPMLPTASTVPISYQAPMLTATPVQLPQIVGQMMTKVAPMLAPAMGAVTALVKKNLPTLSRAIVANTPGAVITAGLVYIGGQLVGKVRRRRRINPLNYRAAMRAASRLCKVHDLTARISQALPAAGSARAPRRRRRRKRC